MKAISMIKPGTVEVIDIVEPTIGPEDVLIELHYVGLCGSDLNAYRGQSPMVTYPRIPGHEVAGVVIAKGKNVPERVIVGSKVTVSPYTNCGQCPACRAGRINTCQFNQTLGVQRDGALAELIAIPYQKVYSSSLLSLQELALVEPMSVGYHAANRGRVNEIDVVLVFGCGAIGLGAIAASACKGAHVIAVDVDENKLSIAGRLGAQTTINSTHEDLKAKVSDLTNGEGASVAIEAVGLPATYRSAIELVSFAGRVVYIGYAKEDVLFTTKLIVSKELDVSGSRNALHVFPSVIRMFESRERPFTELITQVAAFTETGRALSDWDRNPAKTTKILVQMPAVV
ncbi:MAG TPA: zinc-binding alcohol dehydrogenase family protein [Leptolinea sp.]